MTDNDPILRGLVLERLNLAEHDAEERDWRSGANELARIRKYVEALPAVTVGVKPIEWHQIHATPVRWIGHQVDASSPDYNLHLTADSPDVFAWGLDGEGWHGFCGTLDAAKAAAQADYTARILAALTPNAVDASQTADPVVNAPDPAAIREADWQNQRRVDAMRRRHMNAPEDPHVAALCERYGYGAVMDAASRLWARKDSLGAFYIGGCIGLRSDDEATALAKGAAE